MDANSIQFQALITFLMPVAIQLLKASKARGLAWIDQAKPAICVLTSAATALGTATGITLVHSAHSLTVTWPDATAIVHGLLTLLVSTVIQIAGQHALYDGFWKHILPVRSNLPSGV